MDTEEALRRVKLIAPMLRRDVETAILSHAVMEAANDTIPKGMASTYSDFVDTYSAVQNALSLKLMMDLARIFDLSEGGPSHPREKQDKASIQVLGALLRRPDVQNGLEEEAAKWFPGSAHFATVGSAPPQVVEAMLEEDYRSQNRDDCRKAIAAFLALAGRLEEGSEEKDALGRTRDFRHSRLAHALFDKEPKTPKYADLNLLLDLAKEAATSASLAVEGLSNDLGDQARRARQNAEGYAACVLDGLRRAAHNR
jgi:AbiU2